MRLAVAIISAAVTNLFNDLIWWAPFGLILAGAYRAARAAPAAVATKADNLYH